MILSTIIQSIMDGNTLHAKNAQDTICTRIPCVSGGKLRRIALVNEGGIQG